MIQSNSPPWDPSPSHTCSMVVPVTRKKWKINKWQLWSLFCYVTWYIHKFQDKGCENLWRIIILTTMELFRYHGIFPFISFNINFLLKYHTHTHTHTHKTKQTNFRLISLMNMDVKILHKKLANQIQQHIKKLIHHDQEDYSWDANLVQHKQINNCGSPHKIKNNHLASQ